MVKLTGWARLAMPSVGCATGGWGRFSSCNVKTALRTAFASLSPANRVRSAIGSTLPISRNTAAALRRSSSAPVRTSPAGATSFVVRGTSESPPARGSAAIACKSTNRSAAAGSKLTPGRSFPRGRPSSSFNFIARAGSFPAERLCRLLTRSGRLALGLAATWIYAASAGFICRSSLVGCGSLQLADTATSTPPASRTNFFRSMFVIFGIIHRRSSLHPLPRIAAPHDQCHFRRLSSPALQQVHDLVAIFRLANQGQLALGCQPLQIVHRSGPPYKFEDNVQFLGHLHRIASCQLLRKLDRRHPSVHLPPHLKQKPAQQRRQRFEIN